MSKLILFDNKDNIILTQENDFLATDLDFFDRSVADTFVNIKLLQDNKFVASQYFTTIHDLQPDIAKSYTSQPVRRFLLNSNDTTLNLVNRARQLAFWERDNKFCGRCAAPTFSLSTEYAKECSSCTYRFYPRITPCVLAAVIKGDKILLGRAPHFPPGVYSLLAGFVEVGETCEQTVMREVFEEVGVRVNNVRYFGSQPWPFPHSMMIAFIADYTSGDIVVDTNELEDARWFSFESLRQCPDLLPAKVSLSRMLLDNLINKSTVS